MKNILIINHWYDDYAEYCNMINHNTNNVGYLTDGNGARYLKNHSDLAHQIEVVSELKNTDEVLLASDRILNKMGKIDYVIALSEYDLLTAAKVREHLGTRGMNVAHTLKFIDKVHMKNSFKEKKVRIPEYMEYVDESSVLEFIEKIGFPIVFKPRIGASSEGVNIVHNVQEYQRFKDNTNLEQYECERYIEGPIFHIDGIIQTNKLAFVKVWRYFNTCYEYEVMKKPVGSIMVKDKELENKILKYTKEVLAGLEMQDGVFHLEVILEHGEEPIFLEIGARQGGGEVVPLIKELYGVDLIESNFRVQMNERVEVSEEENDDLCAFLLIPEPPQVPCKVISKNSMKHMQTVIKELLPVEGTILDGHGGYDYISGKFWIRGAEEQIERDMNRIISEYCITTEPIDN